MHETITYLGLDRLGLARPDLAIHRLIRKGALHPKRISGHLAFDKAELDIVVANGDQKRGRGRPRKLHSAWILHRINSNLFDKIRHSNKTIADHHTTPSFLRRQESRRSTTESC